MNEICHARHRSDTFRIFLTKRIVQPLQQTEQTVQIHLQSTGSTVKEKNGCNADIPIGSGVARTQDRAGGLLPPPPLLPGHATAKSDSAHPPSDHKYLIMTISFILRVIVACMILLITHEHRW